MKSGVETQPIVGIDIGSTHVSVVVGKPLPPLEGTEPRGRLSLETPQILGSSYVHNTGMRKGTMVDLEAVTNAIADAIDEVERQTGLSIETARVAVSGTGAKSDNFTELIELRNSEVRHQDLEKLASMAKEQKPTQGMECLHYILGYFVLDGKPGILSPEGMYGKELSAIYHRVLHPQNDLYNVLRACNNAGVRVQSFVSEALAASQAVLDEDEKELGVASINIGAELTHVSVYSGGIPILSKDYPMGSHHITKDLAVGLRATQAEAERIKRDYGNVYFHPQEFRETVSLNSLDSTTRLITKGEIFQIIEPRVRELFTTLSNDFHKLKIHGHLAKGVVLTGGGALLNGICFLAEDCFDLQARLGMPLRIAGAVEGLRSPQATTSLGLLSPMFESVHASHLNTDLQRSGKGLFSQARSLFGRVKDSFR